MISCDLSGSVDVVASRDVRVGITLLKDPLDPVHRLRDVIVVKDQRGVVDERRQLHLETVALGGYGVLRN